MAREPKAEATVEDLVEQVNALKAELSDMAARAKDRGEDIADEVMSRGRRAAIRARRQAEAQFEHARELGHDYLDRADHAVRNNPATAMGVAVGVGFLVGLLLARR